MRQSLYCEINKEKPNSAALGAYNDNLCRETSQSRGKNIESFESKIINQKYESAAVYVNGKEVFSKDGNSNSVSFSEQEAKQMKDGVLTHNHPQGRSFSYNDISTYVQTGLKEIRAVGVDLHDGNKYLYTLNGKFKGSEKDYKKAVSSYKRINEKYLNINSGKIRDNKMSISEANAIHHHEVMTEFAQIHRLNYKRTKIN